MINKNRFYVKDDKIYPLEDYQPAEYIINNAEDLDILAGNVFPGSVARIAGTKTKYEMMPNGEWSDAYNEENGAASGGGAFIIATNYDSVTHDLVFEKTWQEIYNAMAANKICIAKIINEPDPGYPEEIGYTYITLANVGSEDHKYYLYDGAEQAYVADTANDYPVSTGVL